MAVAPATTYQTAPPYASPIAVVAQGRAPNKEIWVQDPSTAYMAIGASSMPSHHLITLSW